MRRGFTLIELLVVISIISLLSSVILGSMNQARVKARNTQRNQMVIQYRNALELYRSNNASYPNTWMTPSNPFFCLGGYTSGTCGTTAGLGYSGTQNTTLDNGLRTYFPTLPPVSTYPVTMSLPGGGTATFVGALYACNNAACSNPMITWALEGNNNTCVQGAIADPIIFFGPTDFCTFNL